MIKNGNSLVFTAEDRDEHNRIRIRPATEPAPAPAGQPAPPARRQPSRRAWLLVGGLILAAALIGLARIGPRSAPGATPQPTAAALPTFAMEPTPPAAPATGATLPRAVVAYAAPGGDLIGAIEAGRPYTLTATFGGDWLQLDAQGSGAVWIHAAELPGLAVASLPDLQPPTPEPTSTPVPAPVYVAPPPPTPLPMPPTVCASNMYAEACGQQWEVNQILANAEVNAQATSAAARATLAALPTPTMPRAPGSRP